MDATMLEQEKRQWAMFLHLSTLAGYVVPIVGLVAPILIWQLKKDQLPGLDAHGKVVANWVISSLIYLLFFGVLSIVLIGLPFLFLLLALGLIYPIIGAVKANDGEVWSYPLSLTIFR
ncbi:MAG TPA: DUF4870 domain-containing protein [Thermoanaerobaculia bacterium]|nr:DUF4870 domain-containing protein [Thermoanaerobaculia bacterium]